MPVACRLAIALLSLLPGSRLRADDLLAAPDNAPRYQLSNFRLEDDRFGRAVMVFDYARTQNGEGRVRVAGRSAEGPLQITFVPNLNQANGQVRLGKMPGSRGGGYDYEFYLVTPANWAGRYYGDCLVSNTVRMGNPGPGLTPQRWNAEQLAAYEKQQLADTTPDALPAGHEAVNAATQLVPGMPVRASRYAEWTDAEVLALTTEGRVTIRYQGDDEGSTVDRVGWLAIDPAVRQRAESNPDDFRPSMRVLPGGRKALPRDASAIVSDLELPRGTPLLLHRGGGWHTVYVDQDQGPQISVRYPNSLGGTGWEHRRAELAITKETQSALADPTAAEAFAKNLPDAADPASGSRRGGFEKIPADPDAGWGKGRDEYIVTDRSYPVEARIPSGAQKAPSDLELTRGTPVAYCWARSWEAATVIEDRDSFLIVKEDDNVSSFVYRLRRDQVIIQDKTIRKLRRESGTTTNDLKETLRTWTDSTGKHRVEARFVSVSDDTLTLKTDAGREIKLQLKRLSDEDRKLVDDFVASEDNPFD